MSKDLEASPLLRPSQCIKESKVHAMSRLSPKCLILRWCAPVGGPRATEKRDIPVTPLRHPLRDS